MKGISPDPAFKTSARQAVAFAVLCLSFALTFFIFLYHCLPLDLTPYYERSAVAFDREGNVIAYTPAKDSRLRFLTEPDKVDPLFLKLLLAAEDQRFFEHPGVDPLAVARALLTNLFSAKRVSGASTLDMQCVRLLDNLNGRQAERSYKNKFSESLRALKLRRTLGAQGVLRLYLTLAPMGSRLEGVLAGSLAWFGHLPDHLSPAEAALLTALPRAPEWLRPDRHPQRAAFYVRDVLRRAAADGILDAKTAAAALHEALPATIRKIKQPCFYLLSRLRQHEQSKKPDPHLKNLKITEYYTTIDPKVQQLLLQLAQNFNRLHPGQPDLDLAAVIIDDRSVSVAGYLGGRDPAQNELDLTAAIRSPGSALKPFAYSLAFERRLLHPLTLLKDDCSTFNGYQPLNFSQSYTGYISAHDALIYSLNIPAVRILQRLGVQDFYQRLNSGRQRLFLPRGASPSLPLILGGVGVSLYDLTALYSMLNTQGVYYEPSVLLTAKTADKELQAADGSVFLSPSAALNTVRILRDNPPPSNFAIADKIHYKTGTSHNYADAWALGGTTCYSAGVWVGKRSGDSNYPATGRDCAAPLLFEILTALPAGQSQAGTYQRSELKNNLHSNSNCTVAYSIALTADLERKIDLPLTVPPYLKFFDKTDHNLQHPALALPFTALNANAGSTASAKPSAFFSTKQDSTSALQSPPPDSSRTAMTGFSVLSPELKFIFPTNNSVLLADPGSEIWLEAQGGMPPYLLKVNDTLQGGLSFKAMTVPGFYELTITDSAGFSKTITIKITNIP